jgi:hypothetical protein
MGIVIALILILYVCLMIYLVKYPGVVYGNAIDIIHFHALNLIKRKNPKNGHLK